MTKKEADKIKKVLRKENAVFTDTAGYYDGNELRVKVIDFLVKSNFTGQRENLTNEQKTIKARENTVKVLIALERNGLRPEYRTEQKETANAYGKYDSRYVVFK